MAKKSKTAATGWITRAEAAKILGVKVDSVSKYVQEGKLVVGGGGGGGGKHGMVRRDSVARYAKARLPRPDSRSKASKAESLPQVVVAERLGKSGWTLQMGVPVAPTLQRYLEFLINGIELAEFGLPEVLARLKKLAGREG